MKSRSEQVFLLVSLIALTVISAHWGRYPAPGLTQTAEIMKDDLAWSIVWNIRIPRILMALMLGAALSAGGTVFQSVLGNPLVEPGLLGVSQGAAFGAALAILLGRGTQWTIPLSATVFGLGGLGFSRLIAQRLRYGGTILRLVLGGVVVSALFSSGLGMLKILADPRSELPEITFWLLGGLSSVNWQAVIRTFPPVALCLAALTMAGWRINLLSLDDRSAFTLGTRPGRERIILIVLGVVAVAAVTAMAGIISWVGLLIPHISRKWVGADTARSLPRAMMLGAIFVLLCDNIARGLLTSEIPLGLLTALGGAVLFAVMMTREEKR